MSRNLSDGHRKRVRERLRAEGLEHFADHEVLELLLFFTKPRVDTKRTAKCLLERFGSFKAVMDASAEQLCEVEGVGEESAMLLNLLIPVYRRYCQSSCENLQKICGMRDLCRLCCAQLQDYPTEQLVAILLDAQMRVMKIQTIAKGSLTEVSANVRELAETIAGGRNYGVVLCHNHPNGDARPSREDVDTTKEINRLLNTMRVMLLDHLIISENRVYSMRQNGKLPDLLPEDLGQWFRPDNWQEGDTERTER